jgi:1-deoxyxylulose-5-phosphate synthase
MYYEDSDFEVISRVTKIARKRGVPNAQVALAWLLNQPGVTAPIVEATKMTQLEDAAGALSVKLDAEELKALAKPYKPHPVLGNLQ